jgi:hypothetical protein
MTSDPVEHVVYQLFLPSGTRSGQDWRRALPPLTRSDKINVELYAFLGLICRQFIRPWHFRMNEDLQFDFEVLNVFSNVVQDLEKRVVQVS